MYFFICGGAYTCKWWCPQGPEEGIVLLGLELQAVVYSLMWVLGTGLQFSASVARVHKC